MSPMLMTPSYTSNRAWRARNARGDDCLSAIARHADDLRRHNFVHELVSCPSLDPFRGASIRKVGYDLRTTSDDEAAVADVQADPVPER
jgi:hypothetical protein